jgi:DNA-binding transcriptional ArsR family regulator
MQVGAGLFRLLGDDVRLRILRLLAAERLNVSELTGILGIAQSGVSRHLGLLKEAGLVAERREAGYTYFKLTDSADPDASTAPLAAVLRQEFDAAASTETGRADDARLAEVRRLRRENFDVHGTPDTNERQLVPGRSWAAWARAIGHLLPAYRVADLGCGEGYLTIEASRWASRVIAVDRSENVLVRARALAARRRVRNIIWKKGSLERLPIRDASVDVALLSQALHHAVDPDRAHDEHWVRDRLGDRWTGFTDAALQKLLEGAGLAHVKVAVGARRTGDPFTVLIASGTKPGKTSKADTRKDQ